MNGASANALDDEGDDERRYGVKQDEAGGKERWDGKRRERKPSGTNLYVYTNHITQSSP